MRIPALMLAACAATTLNWSEPGVAADNHGEQRLPHISVRAIGKGDPVVLIPGLSTPRAVWDGIAPELAKTHQVILVQVNGFAGDDAGANTGSGVLDGIVSDLDSYLTAHHLQPAKIVGHSMGGLAALKLALAHPRDTARVMVVDTLPFFATLMDEHATVDAVRPLAEMMKNKVQAAYGKTADPEATEANVKSLALEPESIAEMKSWAAAADPRVTGELLYEDLTTDLRPQLPALTAPVTILVPWSSKSFGEERTLGFYKKQYAALPNATFVGVGEAGHFVMLDQPQPFAKALAEFVK